MHSVPPLAGLGLDVFLGFESCSSCRDGTSESSVSASVTGRVTVDTRVMKPNQADFTLPQLVFCRFFV